MSARRLPGGRPQRASRREPRAPAPPHRAPPPPHHHPPPPPAAPPPARRQRQPERGPRVGRGLWVAAALVALLLAGLIAFWTLDPFSDGGSNASGSSGSAATRSTPPA